MPRTRSIALYWGIRDYLKHCQDKRLTPKTLGWYRQKLELFRLYMARTHHVASAGSVSFQHVLAFLAALQHEQTVKTMCADRRLPMTDATVKGYIQVLQGFFRWAVAQGYIYSNPASIASKIWYGQKQRSAS